jgi:hypothetical protein
MFKDVLRVGAAGILAKYNNSLIQMLSILFPEQEWIPWKFVGCPKNFWEDVNNHKKFIEWLAIELNIKDMNDWYNVSNTVSLFSFCVNGVEYH